MNEPEIRGTRFLWEAAGCPPPYASNGALIPPRDLRADAERERRRLRRELETANTPNVESLQRALAAVEDEPRCASCGASASYRLEDAISDNFTTVKNASRAWPFGGSALCAACVWCARTVALRCAMFFARRADEHGTGGFWFISMRPIPGMPSTRGDPLAALLNPPPPPFVACLPLYGIDHGGEANAHRAVWPWAGGYSPLAEVWNDGRGRRTWIPLNPLVKLQSKHTALYATVSYSATRYRLQVDDTGDITVDVPLWRALRLHVEGLLATMRAQGVGAIDAREALLSLRPPSRYKVSPSEWERVVTPMRPHHGGLWWPLFVSLLRMPELPPRAPHGAAVHHRSHP